ncbi:HD domain-containing protein [Candidatus Tisiphia endosymbiont of Oplodontha viridula]|uniref:HD domain-containing protein n=1 Tax=Candidatus Tisiphia endosymbiont of Oplodontha viridula TaxID=3077925 RepID=UPI0035C8EC5F
MEDINYWDNSKYAPCQYATRLLNKLRKINEEVNRSIDIDEVRKAIYYAKKYHGSQMRQSSEPYYSHPIEVAYMVAEYAASEIPSYFRTDMIVTSILHDTIEDTKLTEKMIEYIFGSIVASQVEALTRVKPYGKISSKEILNLLYQQKKYDVAFIKIFDRIHNLQTIGIKSPEKARKIIEETIEEFIRLAIHLETIGLEKKLIELCYQYLPTISSKQYLLQSLDKFSFQKDFQHLSRV